MPERPGANSTNTSVARAAFHDILFVRGAQLPPDLGRYYLVPLPALGGLVVGLMVVFLAREARGMFPTVPKYRGAMKRLKKSGNLLPRLFP